MEVVEVINTIISKRRSVYPALYTGEIIDEAIIQQMLENANWAPTHKITEPWRFTVFSGNGLKKLADYQSKRYQAVTQADGSFDENKFKNLAQKPLLSSHIISIGMKKSGLVREIEEVEAVACAVQNMYLTAAAHGIGCYWGTGGITYMDGSNEFFGLTEEDKLLGFLYCGVPKKYPRQARRSPISDKIVWISD